MSIPIKRRDFIKISAAGLVAGGLAARVAQPPLSHAAAAAAAGTSPRRPRVSETKQPCRSQQ